MQPRVQHVKGSGSSSSVHQQKGRLVMDSDALEKELYRVKRIMDQQVCIYMYIYVYTLE